MKEKVWIVVANGSVARIFAANSSHTPTEMEALVHPETRLHGRDLVSGKPGRAFDSFGGARHSLASELTPQKNEAHHFADTVAKHLDAARDKMEFTKLYFVISPAFLGLLRNALSTPTREMVALEVDKDATSKSAEEIRVYLPFRL